MAIKPGYKTFTFDGQNSGTYGAYITGSAVYNAPERDVELIKIPGRDGAFVQDNGRFENIEVEYPAGIYAESQEDFAQALSDLRNMLASRKGYCRLTDDYNPEEYRMAVYKSGLDVDPVEFQRAGEFSITFECKPQRWLTSGEAKQTIANSGDTITNPTLFDARPMVETTGYGNLTVNGHKVTLENDVLGQIEVLKNYTYKTADISKTVFSSSYTFDKELVSIGDMLTMDSRKITRYNPTGTYWGSLDFSTYFGLDRDYVMGAATKISTNLQGDFVSFLPAKNSRGLHGLLNSATFTVGTASSVNGSISADFITKDANDNIVETPTVSAAIDLSYDGDHTITVTITLSISNDTLNLWSPLINGDYSTYFGTSKVIADSTATILGTPTYIDCDLGVCYKIEGSSVIDLNRYIDLGSELPYLKSGSNTITFSNTFTKIQIVPRWWKV